jgi:aspartate racemase
MHALHWLGLAATPIFLSMASETNAEHKRVVGVLGGMGPLATVDFLRKLVLTTPATCDQDHIPLVVRFCPEIPDRVDALLRCGPSPEAGLVRAARALEAAGAQCLVIPCNTAHVWHDAIARAVHIPILHIADVAVAAMPLEQRAAVGLLATRGTLDARIYQDRLPDTEWIVPSADEMERDVMPGIRAIKRNDLASGATLLSAAAERLVARGARAVVMACTEIPVALAGRSLAVPRLDPTEALAHACVYWSLHRPRQTSHSVAAV